MLARFVLVFVLLALLSTALALAYTFTVGDELDRDYRCEHLQRTERLQTYEYCTRP